MKKFNLKSFFHKASKPFKDFKCGEYFYRSFKEDVDEEELIWHRDFFHRKIKVYCGRHWKIQFDDQLPRELKINEEFEIPKYTYHRLIKGEGELLLRIEEEL